MAAYDAGDNSSDAAGLLLGATDQTIGMVGWFASCFAYGRALTQIEHIEATVAQPVFGIAVRYEDVVDHDHRATLSGEPKPVRDAVPEVEWCRDAAVRLEQAIPQTSTVPSSVAIS